MGHASTKKVICCGLKFTWNWVSRVLAHNPVPPASGSPDSTGRRGDPLRVRLSTLAWPPEDPAIPRECVRQGGWGKGGGNTVRRAQKQTWEGGRILAF